MFIIKLPLIGIALIGMLCFSSCLKDDYDLRNIDISYNPYIGVPLVNTSFSLNDLLFDLDSNEYLYADSSELLFFSFKDTLTSINSKDLLTIPYQSSFEEFQLSPFAIEDFVKDTSITLDYFTNYMQDPEKSLLISSNGTTSIFPSISGISKIGFPMPESNDFIEAEFSEGTLFLTITNNWPVEIADVSVELRNAIDQSLIGTFYYVTIPSLLSSTSQISLVGRTIKDPIEINILSLTSPGSGSTPVPINLQNSLEFTIGSAYLEIIRGIGTIKDQLLIKDSFDIKLQMTNEEEIYRIDIMSGALKYTIDYGLAAGSTATITFPYITKNGYYLEEDIAIVPQGSSTQLAGEIDLSGYSIDLTKSGTTNNSIYAQIEIFSNGNLDPVELDTSNYIFAEFTIENLEIEYAEGYLGWQSIAITNDTISFPFEEGSLLENLKIEEPKFTFSFNNSFGIPSQIDFSSMDFLNSQNDLISISGDIISNPINLAAPSYGFYGSTATTSYVLSSANSNIKDVFDFKPNTAILNGNFLINPNGYESINFLGNKSYLDVIMNMDIPLYGSLARYAIQDTIEFEGSTFDAIKSADLMVTLRNGFPVDMDVQIYFTDENYQIIDSLINYGSWIVKSALVNNQGEVTSSYTSREKFSVDEKQIDNLRNAGFVIVKMGLATSNNGKTPVKFYTHYSLGLTLGIISQVNFSNNDK